MLNIFNKFKGKFANLIPTKIKKYIPNTLTTLRLLAVPIFCAQFLSSNFLSSTFIFAGACITDALDGFLARKWKVQSKYGKTIDPLADKSLVLSSLILYTIQYNMLMMIPIILESLIAAVNAIYYYKKLDFSKLKGLTIKNKINYMLENGKIEVSEIGRKKTVILMIMTSLAVFNTNFNAMLEPIINTLLLITTSLEVCTLSNYTYNKLLRQDIKNNITKITEKTEEKNEINKDIKEKTVQISKKDYYEKLKKELEFLNKTENTKTKVNKKIK